MVVRHLENIITDFLFRKKTILIYGARQVGKTTLVGELIKNLNTATLVLNGDDADTRSLLSEANPVKLQPVIGNHKLIIIDEAQRIDDAGLIIKIIHDNYPEVQLIVTGSSSLDLAGKIKEPMTGRKFEFFLHPFAFSEMVGHHGFLTEKRMLENRLVFGYYPDVVLNPEDQTRILKSLASDYLYKDILSVGQIKKPVLLEKILKALALQIGSEVSYNELAQILDSDKGTIEKYIDLLEKSFIIFRLPAMSKNVRNEIKKGRKIYFFDNGIRNAVLGNFLSLFSRNDTGALWENFLVSERIKITSNSEISPEIYFWRTTQQQEVDFIEKYPDKLLAYEFKWNPLRKSSLSKTFSKAYPGAEFKVITPDNFHEFLIAE